MSLPCDVKSHIEFISSDFFNSFIPISSKTTQNPFFNPNDILQPIPSAEKRKLNIDIPHILIDVYNKYPSDVEYKKTKGQYRMVDFAFIYAGMGHVTVISYDPDTMKVYCMPDGGSNDFDRHENAQKRTNTDVEHIDKSRIEDLIVHGHKFI